jgi:hypothetical protein
MPCGNVDLTMSIEQLNKVQRCCCNCIFRIQDFHHCTTFPGRQPGECHCDKPKGWICTGELSQGGTRVYSGWSEHGECEMHEFKPQEVACLDYSI